MNRGAWVTVTLNNSFPNQFKQEVLVCGTNGYLVVRGGDLHGQQNSSPKEEVLYLDIENMKQPNSRSTYNESLYSEVPKPYLKGL